MSGKAQKKAPPTVTEDGDSYTSNSDRLAKVVPGEKARDIIAPAVVNGLIQRFYLSSYMKNFILILFYPNDFPIICGDELVDFSDRMEDFHQMDCEVVGISTDSHFAHLAYVKAPRENGGLGGTCNFPLVSDKKLVISKRYGMLHESRICYRGSVLINPDGHIIHRSYHDFNAARSVEPLLRVVQAHRILVGQNEGDRVCYCPEGWEPGDDILIEKQKEHGSKRVERATTAKTNRSQRTQTSVRLLMEDDEAEHDKKKAKKKG